MKAIFFVFGNMSLILGCIGIFLPVLPTTPLLILSVYCFSRGSTRFHRWLISSKLYEKYAKDFVENRTMPLRRKIFLLTLASTMLLFPLIFLSPIWKLVILCVYVYLYYYFIFQIETTKNS